jgi:hypothetical protein
MGRTTTSTYAVRITVPGYQYSLTPWHCKESGRPTDANLARYVAAFEASTQPGGSNAHLGEQHVSSAYVKVNSGHDGAVVARYRAPAQPLFAVVTG